MEDTEYLLTYLLHHSQFPYSSSAHTSWISKMDVADWPLQERVRMMRAHQYQFVDIILKGIVMLPCNNFYVVGWQVEILGAEGCREVSKFLYFNHFIDSLGPGPLVVLIFGTMA